MILMLTSSVLAVLAAAGWWWVTWPERTAREFIDIVAVQNDVEASKMVRSDDHQWQFILWDLSPVFWENARLKRRSLSIRDLFMGRAEFKMATINVGFWFAVERGTVIGKEVIPYQD